MRPEPLAASSSDRASVERLALTLLTVAADQEVRTLEGLAAALVNGSQYGHRSLDHALMEAPPAPFLAEALVPSPGAAPSDIGQKLQLGRRIARRALRGSLNDPTLGASAFHRIDANPAWSRSLLPIAIIGSFLFYALPDSA